MDWQRTNDLGGCGRRRGSRTERAGAGGEERRGDGVGESGTEGMGRRGDNACSRKKRWALALHCALTRRAGNVGLGAGCGSK
jgi:hypothetical protein